MNRRTLTALSLLCAAIATGCNPSYDDFLEEFPTSACTWGGDCVDEQLPGDGGPGAYDCEGELAEAVESLNSDEACEYDKKTAAECLDLLENGDCSEEGDVYGSCERVFTGDDCELDMAVLL